MEINFSTTEMLEALTKPCPNAAEPWDAWDCDCGECVHGEVLNSDGQKLAALIRGDNLRVQRSKK